MTADDQFLADLQSRASRLHSSTSSADRPPAKQWQAILSTVTKESSKPREEIMSTIATVPTVLISPDVHPRPISRFVNVAVTLVVIAALSFGGWFAAMKLTSPETPEPRLAVMASPDASATAQASDATCDVEPLSVDRVIEIVKNPGYFMAYGPVAPPTDQALPPSPMNAVLWEVDPDLELIDGTTVPSDEEFANASEVANAYLDCMVFGTQGQAWTFYSPAHLQQSILAEFQVFRNEEDIHSRVEERLNEPAYTGEGSWEYIPFIDQIAEVSVNPDLGLALQQSSESSAYTHVIMVGVSFQDVDGKQLALTNGTGRDLIPNDPFGGQNDIMIYVTVARHRSGDSWVIIPVPSDAEIGF